MNEDIYFSPEYLKEQRKIHKLSLDEILVNNTKTIIQEANLAGKTNVFISYKISDRLENTIDHFRKLGFTVQSYGNDYRKDYDTTGNEIYNFEFSWYLEEKD